MPSFKSVGGKWEPAHERAFDPQSGEIYDGPDREAKKYIESEGGFVGKDALKDPELRQAARNMGFNNTEEYLEYFKETEQQVLDKKKADAKIITHADEPKKVSVDSVKGRKGGFYDASKDTPDTAMAKKG